jgi:hypothetical protein
MTTNGARETMNDRLRPDDILNAWDAADEAKGLGAYAHRYYTADMLREARPDQIAEATEARLREIGHGARVQQVAFLRGDPETRRAGLTCVRLLLYGVSHQDNPERLADAMDAAVARLFGAAPGGGRAGA